MRRYGAAQLIKIARQEGESQDVDGAQATLELVARECQSIADPSGRANTLALLAETQIGLNNRPAARKTIALAMDAADQVKEAPSKAEMLARLAQRGQRRRRREWRRHPSIGRRTGHESR